MELPITVKRSIEMLGLLALGAVVVLGKVLIMPLLVSFFTALLLLPVLRFIKRCRIPEVPAIIICILLLLILIAGITLFLSNQIASLVTDIDVIQENALLHWTRLSKWISSTFHYTANEQLVVINKQANTAASNITDYLKGVFSSLSSVFIFFGLLPVYIFFILFYRHNLYKFVLMWFKPTQYPTVDDTLAEIEVIVKYYLGGLAIQIAYLTILVGGTLLLFGIKHAILIGVTFAILNLIPYLGPLVGNFVGVVLTLTSTQNFWQVITVLVVIAIVQFLDNNILFPRIMGSKVKINSLASIVGIVAGGTLVGIPGMFLSIPVMAVLKIVFDKSPIMRPWGVLLGEEDDVKQHSQNANNTDGLADERNAAEQVLRSK